MNFAEVIQSSQGIYACRLAVDYPMTVYGRPSPPPHLIISIFGLLSSSNVLARD